MTLAIRGFSLSLCTAFFWGTLPIALKQASAALDPLTIVWLRFSTAALWLWLRLPPPKIPGRPGRLPVSPRHCLLFLVAGLTLGANFVFYNSGVIYMSASATQIVSQAGPLLLMLGGVWLLREPFCRVQGAGGVVLTLGFLFFFSGRVPEFAHLGEGYGLGLVFGVLGALTWAAYGLAHKLLLRAYAPETTLRFVYTFVALGLSPFAHPGGMAALGLGGCLCLAYCCLNTIVAYGCFGRALACWHTAGVGAVLSLTPLFTLICAGSAHRLVPNFFQAAPLNLLGWFGAFLVMLGAGLLAAGPRIRMGLRTRRGS